MLSTKEGRAHQALPLPFSPNNPSCCMNNIFQLWKYFLIHFHWREIQIESVDHSQSRRPHLDLLSHHPIDRPLPFLFSRLFVLISCVSKCLPTQSHHKKVVTFQHLRCQISHDEAVWFPMKSQKNKVRLWRLQTMTGKIILMD